MISLSTNSKDKCFGFLDSFNGKEKEMKEGPEH